MKSIKKFSFVSILVITCLLCTLSVYLISNILTPFYVQASSSVSEESIFKILQEEYPSAYLPFKNLDEYINGYDGIDHIYKVSFTQKMPLFVYVMTKNDYSTSITYLVIFNDLGEIENLIFLNNFDTPYKKAYLDSEEFLKSIEGQKAPYNTLDSIASISRSANFIIEGIEDASLNFTYEVNTKWVY